MEDALLSWQDHSIFRYPEQLDYMKNTPMLFDSDNFNTPPTGKMQLKSYGLSALKIGLDKAKLNTASTWKTMGIISTKRINTKGQIRNAIFATAPMAANADIQSFINVQDHVTIDEMTENISIPIEYGAKAVHLSDEAKPEHIKEISSIIYINGQEIGRMKDSKTIQLANKINYEVLRDTYKYPGSYQLNIKIISYLYTEFAVEGLLKNEIQKDVTIHIIPKKIVPVKNVSVKLLSKKNQQYYVLPLIQTHNTDLEDSQGIVEKNRKLALKIVWNQEENTLFGQDIILRLNGKVIDYEILEKTKEFVMIKLTVDHVENTIVSWNYLRNQLHNYFKIQFDDIGKRIKSPHLLEVIVGKDEKYHYSLKFDTIDKYIMNLNYTFHQGVINQEQLHIWTKVEEWE